MQDKTSVSRSVSTQVPEFIKEANPLFEKFLDAYYRSQEKTGGAINIINNLTDYLDVDKFELNKINGSTTLIVPVEKNTKNIEVENTDGFLDRDGSVIIDDEVIYYETLRKSPDVSFGPSISYSEFNKKSVILSNPYLLFNGVRREFDLRSNNEPIFPPSPRHIIATLYDKVLVPDVDYIIVNDKIRYTTAPRTFDALGLGDNATDISIYYLKGFETNQIMSITSTALGNRKFRLTHTIGTTSTPFVASSTVLSIVIVDGKLLIPEKEYSISGSTLILNVSASNPVVDYVGYINYTPLTVGSGCVAYSVINDFGQVESVRVSNPGSNYKIENVPQVSFSSQVGSNATAKALVNGIQKISLLFGGTGYSPLNPPKVIIQDPTNPDGEVPIITSTVNSSGNVDSLELVNSGSGYDFIPRIQFINPFGAEVGSATISSTGSITSVSVVSNGLFYSTPPNIYIDPPSGSGVQCILQGVLNSDGGLQSVTVVNPGKGYSTSNPPRIKVIQPTGAQVLDVEVDSFGRVINIEILSGGSGYENIPSVYIVDDRKDNLGNPIGGEGAKAVATIFNNQIIDISVTDFGSGYSSIDPPKIYISSPEGARASAEIGDGQITGFKILSAGDGYSKSEFVGCSRGVSGIVDYTNDNKVIFSNESKSVASQHKTGSTVKSLDSVFFKVLIKRLLSQYLPGLSDIAIDKLNIANVLRTVKDFYASKGTQFAIKYLFNLLYNSQVEISYPKDQIIKPSASSWSVDTILRAKLISGSALNLSNGLLVQEESEVDTNIKTATALIENYIAIQTPKYDVYELILSEESITGKFVIPYKTKLTEKVSPTDVIITVDSTVGWPERNGEILINDEVIRYKEKSLTQFIECTRGITGVAEEYDSGTEVGSNFYLVVNKGTSNEVVLSVLGIIEANKTTLLDDGSYYLSGDKLTISKLGSTEDIKLLDSWLYNVKKLLKVVSIGFGGLNDTTATVLCENKHGLLIGDQVTIYGANPIVFNGSFLVTSIPTDFTFTYTLPQPANQNPQGNILISIDLNKGKSDSASINTSISKFATNIQNSFFDSKCVYVAASGIPNYKIGPFLGTALLPGNQRKLNKFPKVPETISLKTPTVPGGVGSYVNGVSVWNYKSEEKFPFGPLTSIAIVEPGKDYDAVIPPVLTVSGGGGSGATARVIVNGSISDVEVLTQGSGYTTSPLVSISGGGGEGATATAVITNGRVSRILVNTGGTGFTAEPIINISGGGGSGATAKASVRGPVSNVIITANGSGYIDNPTISLSSGEGAAAEAYVNNGRLVSIAVIASGNNYTTAPRVIITGDGFGAVAKATISSEGADAGRVTGITILNKGIGYKTGTTLIRLESIGELAEFKSSIFEWTFNLNETTTTDYANGSIFEGFNKQFGGEYGHISNPKQLRFVLGDNLQVVDGQIVEKESGLQHSPIIGWAFDGNPIYGPYGLSDPTNINSGIAQIKSGYSLKPNLVFDEILNLNPVRIDGPPLLQYPAGTFIDDYEYLFRSESIFLDEYNGRFTKTPEYPDGIYAYFVTINTNGTSAFPYVVGPNYYSVPDDWNLSQFAVQAYIPTGIVRYRDPFENVDIDVERQANEETNALTLENGDVLTFEVEDENKDGILTSDEINDPNIIFEEDKLEIFDYFPRIDVASKVDIEVETTTKFEDAKISEFLIENPGTNYQVGDVLVFDDTGTDGYGASASVSKILGETVSSYTYRYNSTLDKFEGVLQTQVPHNLEVGDSVDILTVPQMEPASKTIKVITVTGLENITTNQKGVGYTTDFPAVITVESKTGKDTLLTPVTTSTGLVNGVNIVNSGNSYDTSPRIRVTHPQVAARASYFATTLVGGSEFKIINSIVESTKDVYAVGYLKSTTGDKSGVIIKFNSLGTIVWQKSITPVSPSGELKDIEFISLCKKGTSIYVVGNNRPNPAITNAFNPDIYLAKYTENTTGTNCTLSWQKQYGGISGTTRADYATDITAYNENVVISGYTSTNSVHTHDAFVMYIANNGDSLAKRKITSVSTEDRFYAVRVDSFNNIYLVGNAGNNLLIASVYIQGNKILINWLKQYVITDVKMTDLSLNIDEFNDLYVLGTQQVVSSGLRTRLLLFKLNTAGTVQDTYAYNIVSDGAITASKSSIDIFGEINIAATITTLTNKKYVSFIKVKYDGSVINANKFESTTSAFAYDTTSCVSDVSGDPFVLGSYYSNRTQFLFDGSDFVDKTGRVSNLTTTGTVAVSTTSPKFGSTAYAISLSGKMTATTSLSLSSWTLEGWFNFSSATTTKSEINLLTITDSTNTLVLQINSSTGTDYGKARLLVNATAGSYSTQTNLVSLMNADYAHIAVRKTFANAIATYTVFVNGTQYVQTTSSTNINPTQIDFGNTTAAASNPTRVDDIRLSNYAITYGASPSAAHGIYDYSPASSYIFKFDKTSDSVRMGTLSFATSGLIISRTAMTVSNAPITSTTSNYTIASEGFQVLDFTESSITQTSNAVTVSQTIDNWSARTATVPSTGGQKPKFTAESYGKFFFKVFNTEKVDNVRKLTLNQTFNANIGSTVIQKNTSGVTIASSKVVDVDKENKQIFTSSLTGEFQENTGSITFSDNPVNDLTTTFSNVVNTTPGTFVLNIPSGTAALFKPYSELDYSVRIDDVIAGSAFSKGSVYALSSNYFSFNTAYTQATISGLASVTKITVITNLNKTFQIVDEAFTQEMYVRSATSHYLNVGDVLFNTTSPQYAAANGSFYVKQIISKKEFIFDLNTTPSAAIGSSITLTIFVKHPILRLIFGQQYVFDTSDSSNLGRFLSFYRDNLNKIEYTFKNIIRKGVPGIDEPGSSPFISFKVTDDVSNISYYADPSRIGSQSPVSPLSYIDVIYSPYIGKFEVKSLEGATVTSGATKIVFDLKYEPEKAALANLTTYTTTSLKAVGSIGDIRLVSGGGFYKKLPIIVDIQSSRKIERVEINEPGTEYQPGQYFGVPILGDGNGGKVSITVDPASDPPGQIIEVSVTDPGKGYTTAFIDVDAVDGILGSDLGGSGAELTVVIPPKGTGASVFVKGERIGKIKKLKNNNFGFDYTHDYTLRPEITFPVNLQLTSTSILSSIKVVNPGSGYTSPPEVVITGGGGSGATAQAVLRNGRIYGIVIKNPGSGYTVEPTVKLKSSFNYVVNLDLGLFQFAYPHGIPNGAEVQFNVIDVGEGAEFPLSSFGFLNANQIYYAVSGEGAGLENDQIRIALTPQDAETGNYITFVNTGTGRQVILTDSFGGSAEAVLETARFLFGETVFQGQTFETATAVGFVSENDGWQIGPRLLKLINYTGVFEIGQRVNGLISKSSGIIGDINIAKGVLEVDSITKTTGKFLDDIGKPSEIVQKVQDSYLYQMFSYNIKSPISIDQWKKVINDTIHPAGFKIFGEIGVSGGGKGLTDRTDFELVKSVNLIESSVVSNVDSFALVEPVYSEFDNTQVLFRTKRLTSSEEILTSVVQSLDNIANLFDGARTVFPLTIDGSPVIAQASQFMIVINGIYQAPGFAFTVQSGNIVFTEPPPAPTKISYAVLDLEFKTTSLITMSNVSGIIPEIGNTIRGLVSNATATVANSTSTTLTVFNITGAFVANETIISPATGLNAILDSIVPVVNANVLRFQEKIKNLRGKTAIVEEINLDLATNIQTNRIVISKTSGTYDSPSGLLDMKIDDSFVSAETGVVARITNISTYRDPNVYIVVNPAFASTGSFLVNEVVKGATSNATGEVVLWNPSIRRLILKSTSTADFVPNEIINGLTSLAQFKILTTTEIEPTTTLIISDPSSFYGLLFNRIVNPTVPNAIVDDISKSVIEVVNLDDDDVNVDSNFPEFEEVQNILLDYSSSSRTPKVITVNGNAGSSTLQKKFGSASLVLDGNGDYLQISDATEFDLTTYTFEAWIYLPTAPSEYSMIFANVGENSYWGLRTVAGNTRLTSYDGTTINEQTTGTSIPLNTWTHVAWSRTGNQVRSFINGELVHTGTSTATPNATGLTIGYSVNYSNQHFFNGYIDEMRVSKGIARYVATFTPPLVAFVNDGNTALLIHADSNPIQDDGGLVDGVEEGSFIQNQVFEYTNESGDFTQNEELISRKLSYHTRSGGNFQIGGTITGGGATAQIIGVNYALNLLYLGSKTGSFTIGGTITSGSVSAVVSAYLEVPVLANQVFTATNKFITGYIDNDTRHRYRDAANLIRLNSGYIVDEAVGRLKDRYPDLVIPRDTATSQDGTARCKLDAALLLEGVILDIEKGGTYNATSAARQYLDANGGIRFIELQVLHSAYTHEQLNLLCQQAVIGELSETPEYSDRFPVPPIDITIDSLDCADVRSDIDTLWGLINEVIAPTGDVYKDAGDLLWFNRTFIADEAVALTTQYFTYTLNGVQYSAFEYPGGAAGIDKCKRDLKEHIIPAIISDLVSGGNVNIINAMKQYVNEDEDVLHVKDELLPTIYAIEQTKKLCQYAVDNWIITGTQNTEYQPTFASNANKYKDTTITVDDGEYGGHCADVKSAIEVLFTLGIGILLPEREQYIVSGRFLDAGDLIDANALLIADVAVGRMLANFPGFTVPGGGQNCKDDVLDILNALTYNLRNGGNQQIYDAAGLYLSAVLGGGSHVSGEETQSIYVLNQARDLAIQAMRNETITIDGHSTRTQVKDLTITVAADNCAQVASSITTLMAIVVQAIQNGNLTGITRTTDSPTNIAYRDAAKLIMFNKEYIKIEALQRTLNNFPGFNVPGGNTKCLRDIGYIVDAIVYDLLTNGNSAIYAATSSYIDAATGTIASLEGELIQSIFAYQQVRDLMKLAISETLPSPATASGFYAYTDSAIALSGSILTELQNFVQDKMAILLGTLNNTNYLIANNIVSTTSVEVPTIIYPTRPLRTPIEGSLRAGESLYGTVSGQYAEIESITTNRASIKTMLMRFEVDFTVASEKFAVGNVLSIQGQPSRTCTVYSVEYAENINYIDVIVNTGPFSVGNTLLSNVNFTATIEAMNDRFQLTEVIGSFTAGHYFRPSRSTISGTVIAYQYNSSPVLSNLGGKLTLETESLVGQFDVSTVAYSSLSRRYVDVLGYQGTQISIGDLIKTTKIYRLTVDLLGSTPNENQFPVGELLVNIVDNLPQGKSATILNVSIPDGLPASSPTRYIYIGNIEDDDNFEINETVAYFQGADQYPSGMAYVAAVTETNSVSFARVEKVLQIGTGYRIFLSSVKGTVAQYAQIIGPNNYRAPIQSTTEIVGRISRSFRGFDGVQTTFKLTSNNGVPYFPNEDGHVLIFVNGILQPVEFAYTVFSDVIQFLEPPEIGASFNGTFVGKLRQLDDISFEFDSLRNSFNLKLNEVFYSLTITEGIQSTNIKPENNIIVSLNGVLQEPGVAFEIVGSRINFAEVPRAGSVFVAYSYIGSDADVIAATVIPPIEAGDKLEIEGEDVDRTVAVVESSNSLVTFDYLGSIFGKGAAAIANLTSGTVTNVQLTAGGDGYTSRPTVSLSSSSGFDASVKAIVGISRVDVVNRGTAYKYPEIEIVTNIEEFDEVDTFDSSSATFDLSSVTFDAT